MEAFGLACFYGLTAFDDIRTKEIRMIEVIVFAIIGVVIDVVFKPYSALSIVGGVAVGILVYILSLLTKEKIGKGDAYIVMVSGLYLGFMNTVVVLWMASFMAAIFGVFMTRKHGKRMDVEIPFVPFLLSAFLIVFTIGQLGGIVVCV